MHAKALDSSRAIFREDASEAEKEALMHARRRFHRIEEINEKVQKMKNAALVQVRALNERG